MGHGGRSGCRPSEAAWEWEAGGEVGSRGSASPGLLQRSPARGQRRAGGAGGKLQRRGRGGAVIPLRGEGPRRATPLSAQPAAARPPGRARVPARRAAAREGIWPLGTGSPSTRRPPCSPLGPLARPRLRNAEGQHGPRPATRTCSPAPRDRVRSPSASLCRPRAPPRWLGGRCCPDARVPRGSPSPTSPPIPQAQAEEREPPRPPRAPSPTPLGRASPRTPLSRAGRGPSGSARSSSRGGGGRSLSLLSTSLSCQGWG